MTACLPDTAAACSMANLGSGRPPAVVAENIEKIIDAENAALRPRSAREAVADLVGRFAGTIAFVAVHLVAVAFWVVGNGGIVAEIGVFDPYPYPLLGTVTSVEAVVLAAFVLMKQNRMSAAADRRAHLDLQVNLLTEREATRIIQMLERLSADHGVEQHQDAESRELREPKAVEHLVDELERRIDTAQDG
ncbi:MAG: DUF1003 domain-containing protein [Alphaproteobacteria bacterium]|nr:DUF1003 domain-containing protein [Alphaproteobacteria bacterium]